MAHAKEILCAYCKGKGRSQGSSLYCLVCEARGKVLVKGPTKPCSSCKGAGRRMGENLTCFTCRGKGVIEQERKRTVRVAKPKTASTPRKRHVKVKHKRTGRVLYMQRKCSAAPRVPPSGGQAPALQASLVQETLAPPKEKPKESKQESSIWQKVKNLLK